MVQIILHSSKTQQISAFIRLCVALLFIAASLAQENLPSVQAQAGGPQLILTKQIEGGVTTAQVGDTIRYRIRFECSSLTGPCGEMEITDVLQPGLIYLPPPASSVPAGFTITEAPVGTLTIRKNDNNLLDGSQYDAVIAVNVDYDLRPLPATIDNTINGRIDPPGPTSWINATPAPAPQITIGTANPYWGLTKSLASPLINPTVDTDVTYQIRLCPTTPPPGQGNVPLRNVTITDTLPIGATFVSASGGGTESGGLVTWPVIVGPIYPPNCVSRFVTIRYNTPTFSVGDNVTNTANADGDYTDSSGGTIGPVGVATGPISHPIIPIVEVPTYNKNDTGDPVGITGTGRFTLNLNTNATNYPSNELILIDNLPPELQVTQVTTGQWSAAFDYVHAFVEYSTNNGNSYTAFPGQPIVYNTNAAYAAPAANITNVRWRFEYDPDGTAPFTFTQAGLPYTWSFTTSPEIRVTPRAVATTADPIPTGAPMPAAMAGSTYDNCLQTTRRNSAGNPVTDPCNIEQMTVQGNLVSLRTSKAETPGEGWDDLSDPTILSFNADGSILPGDTLRYTITVEITERSSAPLVDPTIQDTLPIPASDFIFVRNGTASLDGIPLVTQPTFMSGPVLTWTFPGLTVNPLPLGSRFLTVEFYARIPRGQAPGTYTNDLTATNSGADVVCEIGTPVGTKTCQNPDTYVVERSAALRGEKWIRSTDAANSVVVDGTTFLPSGTCPDGGDTGLAGGGSNHFTRYPCISQAFPQGALSPGQLAPPPASTTLDDFEYNLRIFNDGNVPMLSYVLYDILPFVGDTGSGGTLSGSPRLSEFRPVMRGPVEFISGPLGLSGADFTIEYNNTINPCRPEVFNQPTGAIVPGGCNNSWTTIWSASALSYRIRLNSGSFINPASTSSEVRFGVPMYIPLDALPAGFDPNDALSHEIAWNSFSHVGSYDKDPDPVTVVIQDLLASEPRKVGITIPEVMSVGNRVWRDSDNSGTINPPDDTTPGIPGVTVNLYRDAGNDGIPDGGAIATTLTDTGGYYLFSNIPYDSVVLNNNRYLIGIPASNFGLGQPLFSLRSSTGTPPSASFINPAENNGDRNDNGRDPLVVGNEVFSANILLQPATEPTSESDLSSNIRDGLAGQRRGVNGERDNNSDLTIDFGFFGGVDIPFSIGNHVWYDDGTGAGGVINDGIRQANEPPVVGLLVRLYRDGNANGIPEAGEMIRTDLTDSNGFYLFDNLDPGPYYVEIPASEFDAGKPLAGWFSSQTTGTENVGVPGNTNTPNMDSDDNGIDNNTPWVNGIFSGVVVLTQNTEQTGETHVSGEPDPGSPANQGYSPTGWDGPSSRGRFGELDENSNLTIDFGFIPPMSLGNRVFLDDGAGGGTYNNGIMDSGEAPIAGVRVELYRDANGDGTPDTGGLVGFDITDVGGYYLFDRLPPGRYVVSLPATNFNVVTGALRGLNSSVPTATEVIGMAGNPYTPNTDRDDNGINNGRPDLNGILSGTIVLTLGTEPAAESELSGEPNPGAGANGFNPTGWDGPLSRGRWLEGDTNSNLTVDFGFIPVFSLGNRVWFDTDNNSQINGSEVGVNGVRVQLFASDGITEILVGPDGVLGTADDAAGGMLTTNSGYYRFNNLLGGDYVVVLPTVNFGLGAVLEGYWSSGTTRSNAGTVSEIAAPDADVVATDSDDNGTLASGAVIASTVTLGPISAEPTGETDLNGGQGQPDGNANMTVDFGFYMIQLGDLVWSDINNDGILNAGEIGLGNVDIQLWSADGLTLLQTTTTNASGIYSFTALPQGSYILRIPATEFNPGGTLRDYISSTGSPAPFPFEPAPNSETNTTNSDDNGTAVSSLPAGPDGTFNSSLGLGAYDQSSLFALTPAGEASVNNALGLTLEPRIDFGLFNSRQTDLAITKDDGITIYIANQVVNYTIVVTNNGPSDVVNAQVDDALPPQIASWVWTCAAGNPVTSGCTGAASNSSAFQDLINLLQGESVTYNVAATVSGTPSGVLTNTVTVSPPAGVAELNNLNNTASDSDDLASVQVTKDDGLSIVSAGNTITYQIVVTNNGLVNLTGITVSDTLPSDLTYVSATPAPTTQVGNALTWTGISLTVGSSTTISVTATISATPSTRITNIVDVLDSPTGANASARDVDSTASAPNFDITKILFNTDATHTINPQVTIGEILTYEVVLTMPVGSMTNAIMVDTPQSGLAFVDLDWLEVSNPDTDGVANPADAGLFSSVMTFDPGTGRCTNCNDAPTTSPPGNPLIDPNGSKATFSFGTLTNTGAVTETIKIHYSVIVLDVAANQFILGTTLTNNVIWSWDGNNSIRPTTVPVVNVVEPQLSILKDADPQITSLGSIVTFTIDLSHAAISSANAFDVVVTDVLPPGLVFVPGSFIFTRTSGVVLLPPAFNYNPATTTLTFTWDEFQLNQSARLEFQATFVGPSPVQNTASAQWSSLEIDPIPPAVTPTRRSTYNPDSTERWYDPLAANSLDDYAVSSSISIRVPQKLPKTGFAPGVITQIPAMPADFSYLQTDFTIEIPRLGINMNIVGVPFGQDNWDLTWLSNDAGWLEGSAYPTHAGNSALTAHAYLADGTAGPFAKLNTLQYGDQIIVHLGVQKYIYEVRQNLRVSPNAMSVLKHEELPWLTLITCQTYNERSGDYLYRIAVRAVLIKIE